MVYLNYTDLSEEASKPTFRKIPKDCGTEKFGDIFANTLGEN